MGKFAATVVVALLARILAAQSPEATPRFDIADIHTSAKSRLLAPRPVSVRNGRYELSNATMLDLIRTAWGLDADRILGGPNWLELDRFDVIAKVPPDTSPDMQKPMLQALLKDRFRLVAHEETKPVPAWALMPGKKPLMKEADGSGETGCKTVAAGGPQEGGARLMTTDASGKATQIILGPGGAIQFACRNMTMAAFAEGLRGMLGAQVNTPVIDRTGLKGMWNFDVKWSLAILFGAGAGDRISSVEAIDKQLGLKLEQVPIPQTVLVLESVERKPTENAPEVKDVLPLVKPPAEFEVADVKLAATPTPGNPMPLGIRMQPGGRFTAQAPMRLLLNQAFNPNSNQLVGMPSWADSVWVSVTAKMPSDYAGGAGPAIDPEVLAPLMRALLVERFGLEFHSEQRPGTAYKLVAAKPKLKKADPGSRIYCKNVPPSPGQAPANQTLACQNAEMQLFAERLQTMPGINAPVEDATGLEGGWDFTFSFNPIAALALNAGVGRGGGPDSGGPGAQIAASDPSGMLTVFESIEKQLGLKLEAQKKPVPVIVIDKLNQKPTEN